MAPEIAQQALATHVTALLHDGAAHLQGGCANSMQAWANGPACWHCQPGRDCQATQCRQAVAAGDPVSNRGRRQQAADDPLLCHRHNTRYATPHDQLAAMLALVCTLLYSYRGSTAGCAIIIQWPRIYSCNGQTKDTRHRHSDLESNLERHYLIRAYCGRQRTLQKMQKTFA